MTAIDDWSEPIRARAEALAAAIGVPASNLPIYGTPERSNMDHDMKWLIGRTAGGGYRLVWFEHGSEWSPEDCADADEVLYRFFVHETKSMAREAVKGKPRGEKDERVAIGRLQAGMLARASRPWAERCEREVAAEIATRPYRDTPHPFAGVPYYYLSSSIQDVTGDAWQARRRTAE